MKTELKVKFLQHLNKKKREEGFTLIELLVVVIIIGILAAVALPSLLSQANKAKQVEARNNTGTLNRAQQAFHLENSAFSSSIGALGVGIPTETVNYQYTIATDPDNGAYAIAAAIKDKLKAYVGHAYATNVTSGGVTEAVTRANLYETEQPGNGSAKDAYDGGAGTTVKTGGTEPTAAASTGVTNTGWKDLGE
ncbi:MAG: prepilin-type N-terminal cleavage/methylation domain-containing protein [Oscillatoria sp. SIO1A7]|nr:prepilin-type N-terminal cleavage/methylation domain-containing protein [Oscillatoria sp. SIO1A7]